MKNQQLLKKRVIEKKAVLAKVGTKTKCTEAKDFATTSAKASSSQVELSGQAFLREFLDKTGDKKLNLQFTRYHFAVKEREIMFLSVHKLLIKFRKNGMNLAYDFIAFAQNILTPDFCAKAEIMTRTQSDSLLWHDLRYGRVTASKLLQTADCKTDDGSLVREILVTKKVFMSQHMKRSKDLEKMVLNDVSRKEKLDFRDSGLVLLPQFPIFGASPDRICEGSCICEIKCPVKE